MNDELIANSKAFEREKYTLQTLIKKKNGLLDRISLTELAGQNESTLNSGVYAHIDNEIPIGRGEESSQVLRQEPPIFSNRTASD